jgi:hypothetical protein
VETNPAIAVPVAGVEETQVLRAEFVRRKGAIAIAIGFLRRMQHHHGHWRVMRNPRASVRTGALRRVGAVGALGAVHDDDIFLALPLAAHNAPLEHASMAASAILRVEFAVVVPIELSENAFRRGGRLRARHPAVSVCVDATQIGGMEWMAHHRNARRIGRGEGGDGGYTQSNDQSQSHCRLQAISEWRLAT